MTRRADAGSLSISRKMPDSRPHRERALKCANRLFAQLLWQFPLPCPPRVSEGAPDGL